MLKLLLLILLATFPALAPHAVFAENSIESVSGKAKPSKARKQTIIPGCIDVEIAPQEKKTTSTAHKKADEYQFAKLIAKSRNSVILETANGTTSRLGLASAYDLEPSVKTTNVSEGDFVKVRFKQISGWFSADFDGMPMQAILTKIAQIDRAEAPVIAFECLLHADGVSVFSDGYIATQRGNGRLSPARFEQLCKQINACAFSVDSQIIQPYRGSTRPVSGLPPPPEVYRYIQYKQFGARVLFKLNSKKPTALAMAEQHKLTTAARVKLLEQLDSIQTELGNKVPQRIFCVRKQPASEAESLPTTTTNAFELSTIPKKGLLFTKELRAKVKELEPKQTDVIDGQISYSVQNVPAPFKEGDFIYWLTVEPDSSPIILD